MKSLAEMLTTTSIADAIRETENQIKSSPANADLRAALVQFLCLQGNWKRAEAQLQSWQALTPIAKPTTQLILQSVQAEQRRNDVFAGTARPALLNGTEAWVEQMIDALYSDATGAQSVAHSLRQQALETAPTSEAVIEHADESGETKQTPVAWLADGDGRLGPICEVALNGSYYWIPFSSIAHIRFQPPKSTIDLVWSHVLIRLHNGQEQVCQIPARYPLSDISTDKELLARITEWLPLYDSEAFYMGIGQKTWLSEEEDFPLFSLRSIEFTAGAEE